MGEFHKASVPQLFDFKSIQLKTETRGQELELDSADDSSQSPPQKRFLTQRIAKDSGVKRQILAAVAEDLPENYANVKQLWSLVDANSINYFIATDMKLANILFGLQAHTSSHPCSWCEVDSKNLGNSGALRSFGSLRACLKAFENSGSDLSKAKFFGNVVHDPIVRGSDETLIIDVLPPMELHLLLGIVNHLFKALIAVWQNAERWPASLNIEMSEYHSGQFEGNNCRKLLNNVDTLQRLAESDAAFQAFGFIDAFRKFNSVVKACFGTHLEDDYGDKIDQFRSSYLALQHCSITPKAHTVFHHVKDFVSRQKMPLGIFSEQAVEGAHQDFNSHWQRFKRTKSNPEYANKLMNCLVEYNSKHI